MDPNFEENDRQKNLQPFKKKVKDSSEGLSQKSLINLSNPIVNSSFRIKTQQGKSQPESGTESSLREQHKSAQDILPLKSRTKSMSQIEQSEKKTLSPTGTSSKQFSINTYKRSNSFQQKNNKESTEVLTRANELNSSQSPRHREVSTLENLGWSDDRMKKTDVRDKLRHITGSNFEVKPRATQKSPFMIVKKSVKTLPSLTS